MLHFCGCNNKKLNIIYIREAKEKQHNKKMFVIRGPKIEEREATVFILLT
jgi:hypothetical protein